MSQFKIKFNKEMLYYSMYVSLLLYWFIGTTLANLEINIKPVQYVLIGISAISFMLFWVNTKFTKKEYIIQMLVLLVLVVVYMLSGWQNEGLLTFFPLIVGLKNINLKKVVKIMLITLSGAMSILLLLVLFKVIPVVNYTKVDAYGQQYEMIKIANQHGNTIFVVLFDIIAAYLYCYYKKIDLKRCLILQVLVFVLYFLLKSRTGAIMMSIVIWGSYISKKNIKLHPKLNHIKLFLERNSGIIFYIFVFVVGYFMQNTAFHSMLNNLVSSRIAEVSHYINQNGIHLLPQNVVYDWMCDNTQVKVLVSYGLFFTLLYLTLYRRCIKNLQNKGKRLEVFLIIIYLLYSYSEVAFLKPVSDFSALFLIYAFYPERNIENEE